MPPELTQWIPPAVIIAMMLYLHRAVRQDIARMERRLRGEIGELRDRLGQIEGDVDVLREFFVGPGSGTTT